MNKLYKILLIIVAIGLIIIAISPSIINPIQITSRNVGIGGNISVPVSIPTPTYPPLTPAPTVSPTLYPISSPISIYIPQNRLNISYFETLIYTPMDMNLIRGASSSTSITVIESLTIDSTVNCTIYFNKFILVVFLQSTQASPFQTAMGIYPVQQLADHINIVNGTITKVSISYMYDTFYRSINPQIGSLQYNDNSIYQQYPDLSITLVKIN